MVWKRGIAVLSAGNVKVTPDPRIKLVEGYNLEIQDVQTQDAGDYVCQLGTLQPREITHTLEILGELFFFFLLFPITTNAWKPTNRPNGGSKSLHYFSLLLHCPHPPPPPPPPLISLPPFIFTENERTEGCSLKLFLAIFYFHFIFSNFIFDLRPLST